MILWLLCCFFNYVLYASNAMLQLWTFRLAHYLTSGPHHTSAADPCFRNKHHERGAEEELPFGGAAQFQREFSFHAALAVLSESVLPSGKLSYPAVFTTQHQNGAIVYSKVGLSHKVAMDSYIYHFVLLVGQSHVEGGIGSRMGNIYWKLLRPAQQLYSNWTNKVWISDGSTHMQIHPSIFTSYCIPFWVTGSPEPVPGTVGHRRGTPWPGRQLS